MIEHTVIVRVASHRARHKLYDLLGVSNLPWFWSWEDGNNFAEIPTDQLASARAIKGITAARPKGELMRCWKFSD
jgi:hypothetical protein